MRDERTNSGAPGNGPVSKHCSGCGRVKPASDFYSYRNDKLSSRCKDCQCSAARTTSRNRQNALRALIAAHNHEYRSLLAAERAKSRNEAAAGGDSHVA
jgi:recombinational DNA repair protein (RecF pathway)